MPELAQHFKTYTGLSRTAVIQAAKQDFADPIVVCVRPKVNDDGTPSALWELIVDAKRTENLEKTGAAVTDSDEYPPFPIASAVTGASVATGEPATAELARSQPHIALATRAAAGEPWALRYTRLLEGWGLDAEICNTLVRMAARLLTERQAGSEMVLRDFTRQCLVHLLRSCGAPKTTGGSQRRVALLGPTGVGKTTTVAKLAADAALHRGQSVALITLDNYRIAAAAQLRTYGELLQIPCEMISSPEQLPKALERFAQKDLVLIDTAGRSPQEQGAIEALRGFLRAAGPTENHLVLAASTRERDQLEMMARFATLPLHYLLLTKLDECCARGSLVNLCHSAHLPISYLCGGQRVPEDLLAAEPAKVAEMIVGGGR